MHTEHFFVLVTFFVIFTKDHIQIPSVSRHFMEDANTPQMDFLSPTTLMWSIPRNQFREIYLLFAVI